MVNSNSFGEIIRLANNTVTLCKIGRVVIADFYGTDAYSYRSWVVLIPDANAKFRPYRNISFEVILYASETSTYIGNIDLTTAGSTNILYKDSISSRKSVTNGQKIYGSTIWITSIS